MARLYGKRYKETIFSLEIEPVVPILGGDENAYDVTLFEENNLIFKKRYHVWQYKNRLSLGHFYMFRIARAFQHASDLIDLKTDFTLSPPFDAPHEYHQPLCIRESIDWLEVVLWEDTVKIEPRFFVEIFVSLDSATIAEDDKLKIPIFANLTFCCSPQSAEEFGKLLEAECEAARIRRKELGIPAWDDLDDD